MKQQEITTLKLIESIERDPEQTQRDLAKELDISLGLVNAIAKRLISKGYFKFKPAAKKRMKYILTRKGMHKKCKLEHQYILYSLELYKETREKMKSIYDQLIIKGKKRIYLIGAGELSEIALITLCESKLEFAGIIENEIAGKKFLGKEIMNYAMLKNASPEDIVLITIASNKKKICEAIQEYISKDNIISYFDQYQ